MRQIVILSLCRRSSKFSVRIKNIRYIQIDIMVLVTLVTNKTHALILQVNSQAANLEMAHKS